MVPWTSGTLDSLSLFPHCVWCLFSRLSWHNTASGALANDPHFEQQEGSTCEDVLASFKEIGQWYALLPLPSSWPESSRMPALRGLGNAVFSCLPYLIGALEQNSFWKVHFGNGRGFLIWRLVNALGWWCFLFCQPSSKPPLFFNIYFLWKHHLVSVLLLPM